jgi:ADP-ribose pyrophosphatase YjhB (NUDIX family)
LGETLQQGVVREVLEETGLNVVPAGIVEVLDRITLGEPSGRVRYHYVLIDFLCHVAGGTLRGGSDAEEARWVAREELQAPDGYRLAPFTVQVIEKAFRL